MKVLLIATLILFMGLPSYAAKLDATFGYSFADEIDRDGGDIKTESAFTLGARFKEEIQRGFGYNVGLGLDTIRDFDNTNGDLGFFLLEGNATLILDQIQVLYVFVGLNYPIAYKDSGISDLDSVLGVQFGTGIQMTPQFGAELAFRTVNFEIAGVDSNLWGFAVRGYYTFAGL